MTDRGIRWALYEGGTSLRDFDRWATLAWIDTTLRYRRTVLGPWWVTLSTGAMVFSVGWVWGSIVNIDAEHYMPYFASGFIIWTLISGSLTEGCNVFISAGGFIKSMTTPFMVHVHRLLARQLIVLAHNLVLIVLLWALFRWPIGWSMFLFLPGVAIVTITLTGAVLVLGILCTRFRDIAQIISAILQLLFLLTPIMWTPESIRGRATKFLLDFNPFNYLLQIVRGPLLGHPPPASEWLVAIGIAGISLLAGYALYGRLQHRLAYWL